MRTRTLVPVAAVALALTAAGCGDDNKTDTTSASDSATPTTKTVAADATIGVTTTPEGAIVAEADRAAPTVPKGSAPTKLEVKDLVVGTGPPAKDGDALTLNYTGVLTKTGKVFDTSFKAGGSPIPVTLGTGGVIKGWDEGIVGMKVGGRRELVIPADLAYGKAGQPPTIPPNSDLTFVIDLVSNG